MTTDESIELRKKFVEVKNFGELLKLGLNIQQEVTPEEYSKLMIEYSSMLCFKETERLFNNMVKVHTDNISEENKNYIEGNYTEHQIDESNMNANSFEGALQHIGHIKHWFRFSCNPANICGIYVHIVCDNMKSNED
jgi:hypothetical protein